MIMCNCCKKTPEELEEYRRAAEEWMLTPSEYVVQQEGTFNKYNGHFLCTDCWIKAGCPKAPPPGWKAP
jgi:hypothetical protein